MSEHEPPGYDDWFDEPEPPTLEQGRGGRQPYDAPSETEEDVWTLPEDESGRPRRTQRGEFVVGGRALTTTQIAILAIAGLAVLIAILAAAGVFSSTPASTTLTSNSTPTLPTTATQTTTTVTLTVPTQPMQIGATGPQVKLLQAALKSLGFYTGTVDGQFGQGTKDAVIQFQAANNLNQDGIVGHETLAKLKQQVSG
jgi:hypothetical protein